jgi:hypothetical protein
MKNLIKLNKQYGYGFDDRYVCDKKGTVYNTHRDNHKMKPFINHKGYVEYVLTKKDGKKIHIQAQRIVAGLYIPNPKNLPEVNHKSGLKTNNKHTNLAWVTKSDNNKHKYRVLGHKPHNKK